MVSVRMNRYRISTASHITKQNPGTVRWKCNVNFYFGHSDQNQTGTSSSLKNLMKYSFCVDIHKKRCYHDHIFKYICLLILDLSK